MALKERLAAGLQKLFERAGRPVRFRYYTMAVGSVWDDGVTLTEVTGSDTWTSGIIQPINGTPNSWDSILLEQGKIQSQDQKLFIHGSLVMTGSDFKIKVQFGSPTGEQFTLIEPGTQMVQAYGEPIYKRIFIRRLPAGSFIEEM